MLNFDELFDRFLTSKNELPTLPENNLYDKHFQSICAKEEKGTSFFHQFLPHAVLYNENPPFEVTAYKVFDFKDEPGILELNQ